MVIIGSETKEIPVQNHEVLDYWAEGPEALRGQLSWFVASESTPVLRGSLPIKIKRTRHGRKNKHGRLYRGLEVQTGVVWPLGSTTIAPGPVVIQMGMVESLGVESQYTNTVVGS